VLQWLNSPVVWTLIALIMSSLGIFQLLKLPTEGADRSRTNRGLAKIEIMSVATRPHVRSAKSFMLGMELECRHNQRTRLAAAASTRNQS
jgi:hypothetical protein